MQWMAFTSGIAEQRVEIGSAVRIAPGEIPVAVEDMLAELALEAERRQRLEQDVDIAWDPSWRSKESSVRWCPRDDPRRLHDRVRQPAAAEPAAAEPSRSRLPGAAAAPRSGGQGGEGRGQSAPGVGKSFATPSIAAIGRVGRKYTRAYRCGHEDHRKSAGRRARRAARGCSPHGCCVQASYPPCRGPRHPKHPKRRLLPVTVLAAASLTDVLTATARALRAAPVSSFVIRLPRVPSSRASSKPVHAPTCW
jgi:hypothetical protein